MSKMNFENRTDIVRDVHTKAVLSTDKAGYIMAKKRKEDQERYIRLEKDVKNLKTDISDIKTLLHELLNRGST